MQNLSPLTRLLTDPRSSSNMVAYDREKPVLWGSFVKRVASAIGFFRQATEQAWGVYLTDSFEFAVILLALWQTNKEVVLLKDNLVSTVNEVSSELDALVGDFSYLDHSPVKHVAQAAIFDSPEGDLNFKTLIENDVAVYVYTSGSTGAPKKIPVRFFQLIEEIASHENQWGARLLTATVASTASHQHLYGLIFKVLWPLSAGRPFVNENIEYLEELAVLAKRHSHLTVISTPSHLGRLPETLDWDGLRECWTAVFSSTAPLSLAQSQEAQRKFGVGVTEIYGSSETGGIAWREQSPGGMEFWQVFAGIKIRRDEKEGVLQLLSPFMAGTDFYITSDKVELIGDNRFKLLGRVDRIAKVEGKRVSLNALENALLEISYVTSAGVVTRTEKRVINCAVVELSEAGWDLLREKGTARLTKEIRQYLRQSFEAVVIPRKWRYVEKLPSDAQGKITYQGLQNLFEKSE